VLAAGEQQERLIEALLTLARSQRGLDRREPVDLAEVVEAALPADVAATLRPAGVLGDRRLIERLVTNLVDNAVRHNVPGGWVYVATANGGPEAILRVVNSGPRVRDEEVPDLLEPFRRAGAERSGHGEGLGLGLSIAAAVAAAHGAALELRARPEGGLDVEVRFQALQISSKAAESSGRSQQAATSPSLTR
jgi:signal transduction histidine kinase